VNYLQQTTKNNPMHTENDAKNLWCPLVQHEGKSGGSFSRGWSPGNPLNRARSEAEDSHLCNCIGSRCAVWRWTARPAPLTIACQNPRVTTEPPRPEGMPAAWIFIPCMPYCGTTAHWTAPNSGEPKLGYCGWIVPRT
jgi:hypothetical protein